MKYSDKRKEKAINTFKLAMGTAQYCKSCRALMTYGVNSKEAMVFDGFLSAIDKVIGAVVKRSLGIAWNDELSSLI